jgi:transposase
MRPHPWPPGGALALRDLEGVEPTNNNAERELRSFVLWRKASLRNQSLRGDAFAASMKSVIQTCRKQKPHVWASLTEATQAHLSKRSAPSLLTIAP